MSKREGDVLEGEPKASRPRTEQWAHAKGRHENLKGVNRFLYGCAAEWANKLKQGQLSDVPAAERKTVVKNAVMLDSGMVMMIPKRDTHIMFEYGVPKNTVAWTPKNNFSDAGESVGIEVQMGWNIPLSWDFPEQLAALLADDTEDAIGKLKRELRQWKSVATKTIQSLLVDVPTEYQKIELGSISVCGKKSGLPIIVLMNASLQYRLGSRGNVVFTKAYATEIDVKSCITWTVNVEGVDLKSKLPDSVLAMIACLAQTASRQEEGVCVPRWGWLAFETRHREKLPVIRQLSNQLVPTSKKVSIHTDGGTTVEVDLPLADFGGYIGKHISEDYSYDRIGVPGDDGEMVRLKNDEIWMNVFFNNLKQLWVLERPQYF